MKCIHNLHFGVEHTFGSRITGMQYRDLMHGEYYGDKTNLHKALNLYSTGVEKDSDCIEIPSVKLLLSKLNVFDNNYIKIKELLFKEKIKESSCYARIQDEGGGHIHLSLKYVAGKIRKNFYRNMVIFSINNPELAWVFNNPFDKDNSLSMLKTHDYIKLERSIRNDSKRNGLIFSDSYNTIEFRFFMMHRNLEECHLHLRLSIAIYNYLFNLSNRQIKLYLKYTDLDQFPATFTQAKNNILELFKTLQVSDSDIKYIKKERFKFMKQRFDSDAYYKKRILCC